MPTNETPAATRLDPSVQAIRRIARMRLLRGVPFQYLVPTEEALPVESIRFFHIDQNWLDALVDGALNVCMRSKSDLEWLNSPESDGDSRYTHLLRDVNQLSSISRGFYRKIFNRIRSERGETSIPTSGGSLTGMLLRSTIVRDYPGLEISAYKSNSTSTDPWKRENWVQTLRMEKLSSSIILCIFNDLPTHVRIQEPSEGLRMGVDGRPDSSSNFDSTSFMLKLKNSDGTMSLANNQQVREMSVRTRSNPSDNTVLDISGLFNGLQAWINADSNAGFDNHDSALLATQFLQLPYQQDFLPTLTNIGNSTGVSK